MHSRKKKLRMQLKGREGRQELGEKKQLLNGQMWLKGQSGSGMKEVYNTYIPSIF